MKKCISLIALSEKRNNSIFKNLWSKESNARPAGIRKSMYWFVKSMQYICYIQ